MAERSEVGEELDAVVADLVRSGRYSSPTDVLQHAVCLLRDQDQLEWLRAEIKKGEDSGPGIPADEFFAELRRRTQVERQRRAAE